MRNKILCFLFLLIQIFLPTPTALALDANDFYFDSFDADYFLSKNDDGTSHLKVVETLVAVFPDFDQNHGITREIPYKNQDGKNITIESKSALNLSVTRNGDPEPFSIEQSSDAFNLRIGSADSYVHGRQTYVLSYEFTNVITDFDTYQELYWDTNGTGWYQPFNSLTARIHFSNDIENLWSKKSWCYVGAYGNNNQSRCETNLLSDGIEFKTKNLSSNENLTFDLEFNPDSFNIIKRKYTREQIIRAIVALSLSCAPIILYLILIIKPYKASLENRNLIKNSSVVPEYTPPYDLNVAESQALLLQIKQLGIDFKVATLIELAVNRKIQLIKSEPTGLLKRQKWQVKILTLEGLTTSEKNILSILKNSTDLIAGETIEIKSHSYSSSMSKLDDEINNEIKNSLIAKQFFSGKVKKSGSGVIVIILFLSFLTFSFSATDEMPILSAICAFLLFLSFIVCVIALISRSRSLGYLTLTKLGIERINYLNGLKYYMSLAETERIKFLQSIDNVDTSPEGIVNLYEKLLPYAIIFGLEESWLRELNHYYETTPTDNHWFYGASYFSTDDFHSFTTSATSDFSSSTTSSDSSSSSGGGGGGSSGGGGGGGGGGGW